MSANSRCYDPELQMFVEPIHEPSLDRLCFLRWLIEQGRLEHTAAGEPVGPYALYAAIEERLAA